MPLLRCPPSSTVAQRQSNRLLTDGFLVRIQAVEPQCLATRGVFYWWTTSSHFFHNRHDNEIAHKRYAVPWSDRNGEYHDPSTNPRILEKPGRRGCSRRSVEIPVRD